MEHIVKEYIRNNQLKNHQLGQDNTLKKKKPLTYNEIKKVIDSVSDFNKSDSKPPEDVKLRDKSSNSVPKAKAKGKKSVSKMMKKYNFEIT